MHFIIVIHKSLKSDVILKTIVLGFDIFDLFTIEFKMIPDFCGLIVCDGYFYINAW